MKDKNFVKIRFNTSYMDGDGSKDWRVIINGIEHFCNHISINCSSKTSKDFIEGVGDKWHISCEPIQIEYIKDDTQTTTPVFFLKEIILS